MPVFLVKNSSFGFSQTVEDPPLTVRVLDAKMNVVGRHRSRKNDIQHLYAPKCAMFHAKMAKHQNFSFFASDKQLKTPPPRLRVLDVKKQVVEAYRSQKHNLQHPFAPKSAIFHEKMAKNGRFLVKN